MNTNTEHLHEDQENSWLHKKSWKLIFFRRHCWFSLHLMTTTCHFWSAPAQLTAKVLVPTLTANSNTSKISSCLARTQPQKPREKHWNWNRIHAFIMGPQDVHTATLCCEQRERPTDPPDLSLQTTSVLSYLHLAELHLKRRRKKKKKNSSQPEPKIDSLQLPGTRNLHRQRNFTTVLPRCPR